MQLHDIEQERCRSDCDDGDSTSRWAGDCVEAGSFSSSALDWQVSRSRRRVMIGHRCYVPPVTSLMSDEMVIVSFVNEEE